MFKYIGIVSAVLLGLIYNAEARTGIIDGIPIRGMHQFPHAVTIQTTEYRGLKRYCSGSILNTNWILSSWRCVYNGDSYELIFNRTNLNDTHSKSFSVKVDNSSVHRHPNTFADLALIELPVELKFSNYIRAVPVLTNAQLNLTNRYAVMPGIGNGTLSMSYGKFEIISPEECRRVYGDFYSRTTQICTQGYRNNTNVPCWNNEGAGLLINWPNDPILVGTFNAPASCLSRIPAEYMRVTAFVPWINSIIKPKSV